MTRAEFNTSIAIWFNHVRVFAVDHGFPDPVDWIRSRYEIAVEIFTAENMPEGPDPLATINLLLMKGWDPDLPDGWGEPPDGSAPQEFEPEHK